MKVFRSKIIFFLLLILTFSFLFITCISLDGTEIDAVPFSAIYATSEYASNSDKPMTIDRLYDGNKQTDWACREDSVDGSGFCVLNIPDELSKEEFRYIGIRKNPSDANHNIGQLSIATFNVYGLAENYSEHFERPVAEYDSQSGALNISTVMRTLIDRSYTMIVAGYSKSGALREVHFEELLAPSLAQRTAEEVKNKVFTDNQGIGYATTVERNISFYNPQNISYAKIMIFDDMDGFSPILAKSTSVEINRGNMIQLLYDNVRTYMKTDDINEADAKALKNGETDRQLPYTITWDTISGASSYTLELSQSSDYSNARVYNVTEPSCKVTNLYIGTVYYWRALSDNGGKTSGSFETEDCAPRWINAESVANIRDIGGWSTENGKKVKQGLIYRGAGLSNDKEDSSVNNFLSVGKEFGLTLSENDRLMFVEELGIKTEIDLRGSENGSRTTSPLGADVQYFDRPSSSYADAFGTGKTTLKNIFKDFAKIENYPIYFHCAGGADRTGTVAFLLNGLLGVSKDNLIRDWECTTFSRAGDRYRASGSYGQYIDALIEGVEAFEGNTLQEKIENLLLRIGVTQNEIESIKSIMLQ